MTIETRRVSSLTQDEIASLKRLTYGDLGSMRYEFITQIANPGWRSRVVIARDKDKIIGWGLIFRRAKNQNWNYYTYVATKYRKKGVARRLFSRARQGISTPLIVYPGNQSRALYHPVIVKGRAKPARFYENY